MLKIDLRSGIRARRVGGVLLLAVGGLFVAGPGPDDQAIARIGFGVCALLVGLVLIAARHVLIVDQQAGVIARRRGLIFTFPVASFAIADVNRIALVNHIPRSSDDDDTSRYRLLANGNSKRWLADLRNVWHARHVAEQICRALNVPFDNRIYHKKSVRQASELDLSVAERWAAAGEVHERPGLPLGSALSVEQKGSDVYLWVPATDLFSLKILAIVMAVFAGMAALFSQLATGSIGNRVFFFGCFGFCGLVLCLAALSKAGRSRLKFSDRRLSVRLGLMPFPFSMPLEEIEEMIPASDSIVLVGDRTALSVDWPKSKADKEFLRAFVAYELGRRRPAPSD